MTHTMQERHHGGYASRPDASSPLRSPAEWARCAQPRARVVATFTHDFDGRILTWSDEAALLYACPAGEAIGRHLVDLVSPSCAPWLEDILLDLHHGQIPEPRVLLADHPEGAMAEILHSWTLARGADNHPLHAVVLARESDDAALDFAPLLQDQQIYRLIAETVPYGIWLCDAEGRCNYLSESFLAMLGMSMQEVAHKGWLHRVHPDDRQPLIDAWTTCARTADRWLFEYRVNSASGEWIDILAQARAFPDRDSNTCFWAGLHLDITSRKQLERELKQLNDKLEERVEERARQVNRRAQQLRRLANELTRTQEKERERLATMLHDSLQQTLTAAVMRTHVLCNTQKEDTRAEVGPELQQLLRDAIDECRSLSAELRPGVLHDSTLDKALAWLAESIENRHGLRVALKLEELAEPEDKDIKFQLFEAIRELLFNVVKHAKVDAATLRNANDVNGYLHLIVSDQGVGMSTSDRANDQRGSGLTSAHNRLELLGGHLEVVSKPGEGCDVHLYAPQALGQELHERFEKAQAAVDDEQNPAPRDAEDRSGKISIILADDHEIVRAGLSNLLQLEEDLVVLAEAEDGVHLVELVARLSPEVAVIDVNMPQLNSVEATRTLKAQHPDLFIIGLSVNEDPCTRDRMQAAGAAGFYTKGSDFGKLCEMIRSVRHR